MQEDQKVLDMIHNIPLPTKDVWPFYKWRDMYSVAVTYPDNPSEEDMDQLEAYMRAQAYLMPCDDCKRHFKEHVNKSIKNARKSRTNVLLWLFSVQNDINSRTGKHIYDTEQSVNSVSNFMSKVRTGSGVNRQLPVWVGAVIAMGALVGGIGIGVGIQKSRRNE